jgi:hypothetical protein
VKFVTGCVRLYRGSFEFVFCYCGDGFLCAVTVCNLFNISADVIINFIMCNMLSEQGTTVDSSQAATEQPVRAAAGGSCVLSCRTDRRDVRNFGLMSGCQSGSTRTDIQNTKLAGVLSCSRRVAFEQLFL